MDIIEIIDAYVDAFVAFEIEINDSNLPYLQANVDNKYETMKAELEKADARSLKICIDALEQAINAKRMELDALSSRYALGVSQKNVATINDNPYAEKRYDQMIEETLLSSRRVEIISEAYKEALKEATAIINRRRS